MDAEERSEHGYLGSNDKDIDVAVTSSVPAAGDSAHLRGTGAAAHYVEREESVTPATTSTLVLSPVRLALVEANVKV